MPKSKRPKAERVSVRLPKPMVDEVDRIVKKFRVFSYNRQQFIEAAVREKIEKIRLTEKLPEVQDIFRKRRREG